MHKLNRLWRKVTMHKINEYTWSVDGKNIKLRNQEDFLEFVENTKDAFIRVIERVMPEIKSLPLSDMQDYESSFPGKNIISTAKYYSVNCSMLHSDFNDSKHMQSFIESGRIILKVLSLLRLTVYVNKYDIDSDEDYKLIPMFVNNGAQALYTSQKDWIEYQKHLKFMIELKSKPIFELYGKETKSLKEMVETTDKGKPKPKAKDILINNPQTYLYIDEKVLFEAMLNGMTKWNVHKNGIMFFGMLFSGDSSVCADLKKEAEKALTKHQNVKQVGVTVTDESGVVIENYTQPKKAVVNWSFNGNNYKFRVTLDENSNYELRLISKE